MSVMSNDLIIRTSVVEHELKSAFVNTSPRLVRMQMDEQSISFGISFQKEEVFLKQLFCDCLYSNGLKYSKDDKGIVLHEDKHFASFLNSMHITAKDFKNQMLTMGERSINSLGSNVNAFFAQSSVAPKQEVTVQPGMGG